MSDVIQFLMGQGEGPRGLKLGEVLAFTDYELEHSHDIIQWLFPSDIPSKAHPDSPTLTPEQIQQMKGNTAIDCSVSMAFCRYVLFLKDKQWLTLGNHNYLRMTRILRCFHILGIKDLYDSFQKYLESVYQENPLIVGEKTHQFWLNASNDEYFK